MKFRYSDGGRADSGFKGTAGDCVVRAISIASNVPYRQVYNELMKRNGIYADTRRGRVAVKIRRKGSSPRNGNFKKIYDEYIKSLGFKWHPTMKIGEGCHVHLRSDELPLGRLIVRVSKHLVAVIDGVIHDTHDCSRDGTRCVYGYYIKEEVA